MLIDGDHFVPGPISSVHDVAEAYMAEHHPDRPYTPPTDYHKLDPEHSTNIARAFEEMPHSPDDPATKASYDAMIKETLNQYGAIKKSGLKVEFIPPDMADPYASNPRLAAKDVAENNHLWTFPTDQGFGSSGPAGSAHPMLQPTGETISGKPAVANDIFRVVHDYFGHLKEGHGFRAAGEDNAWRSHAAMYSDIARPAMTTETRGQNSWVNYGPHGETNRTASAADTHYADQKVGLMPEWTMRDRGSPDPIIAYNGSPHSFDKFDISKIGAGEGNQAYGHGLYFAEHEPVSEWYRHQLASRRDPLLEKYGLDSEQGANLGISLAAAKGDAQSVIAAHQEGLDRLRAENRTDKATKNMIRDRENKIAYLQDPERSKGHMYQVAINADPQHFLDWDAALKDQHPVVQQAVRPVLEEQQARAAAARQEQLARGTDAFGRPLKLDRIAKLTAPMKPIDEMTGQDAYGRMGLPAVNAQEGYPRSAQRLNEAGVPGIKYLDQASRLPGVPNATRNYVTFDDKLVKILKRYGVAGLPAGASGFGSLRPQEDQQ